ncbi:hypothetical protein JCM10449v2_001585 [Rhodotorula kratochvilovae]
MASSTVVDDPPPPPAALSLFLRSLRARRATWVVLLAAVLACAIAQRAGGGTSSTARATKTAQVKGEVVTRGRPEVDKGVVFPPLETLRDRDRLWPPDLNRPLCNLKIYVYDLPPELRLPDKTVSQCRWSAYNSELLLHQLLVESPHAPSAPADHPHHSLYTEDPAEADFFLVPLFPACFLFDCWVKAGWTKTARCNVDAGYIQPIMAHVRTAYPHWNASGGADHLVFHPMDYVDGYYTEQSRAAMNSSTYLVTVGDVRPAPYGSYFRAFRDLVIPSATHLLNSYRVNPLDYLDADGFPLVEPRGAASPHRRVEVDPLSVEIFEPSSEPVDQSFGGWMRSLSRSLHRLIGAESVQRDERSTLALFRGGLGTPEDGERYALGIRSLFFPSDGNASTPPFSSTIHPGFSSLAGFDIAESSENDDYARRLARARFGLAPPGYTLDTTRVYEYLAFGVVPVFIGSGPAAGQVMPFARDVDWSSFTLSLPRERAHELPRFLAQVSEEKYERMRRNVWEVGRKVVLEGREGNVWKLLARDLCRLKRRGIAAGPAIANN